MKKHIFFFLFISLYTTQGFAQMPPMGKIEYSNMPSEILGKDREFAIYLPKSYATHPERKYPVLYLLHGGGGAHTDWPEKANLAEVANQLIDSKEATEMIIVCPEAGKDHMSYFNHPDWKYEDYFFQELIPFIESNYRAYSDKNHRAIAGLSMGGQGTVVYAQHHPELFSSAYAMSSYLYRMNLSFASPNDPVMERLQKLVEDNNAVKLLSSSSNEKIESLKTVEWFIDCGDDDFTLSANLEFVSVMKDKKIPFQFRIRDGGHTWEYWHSALYLALPFATDIFREANSMAIN